MVETADAHPHHARSRAPKGGMVAPEKVAAFARREGVSLDEAEKRLAALVRRESR